MDNQWNREHIGSHSVRHNRVSFCGQAGIAGSLGAIFSTISDNVVHDIGSSSFWGYELAGIKLHAAIDAVIEHNHIYRTEGGIWLDWMTQGTRVTRNLLHDNRVQDFSLEVNHGPIIVDNNLFFRPNWRKSNFHKELLLYTIQLLGKYGLQAMWMNGKLLICFLMTLKLKDTMIVLAGMCVTSIICSYGKNLSMYENSKLPTKDGRECSRYTGAI